MPSLTFEEFSRAIGKEQIKLHPVMAVTGDEDFIRNQAISQLRGALEAQGHTFERFSEDGSAAELIARLRTQSLFGDKVALCLRSQRRGNRSEAVVRMKEELLDYLDAPSRSNILIIDGVTWNGNFAVPRRVKKEHLIIQCPAFKPWQKAEVERFIDSRATGQGLKLAPGVASELRDTCGDDLGLVERELEKLALVVGSGGRVTLNDLAAHLKYRGGDESFELCDAVLAGNRERALHLSTKVVRNNDPGPILQFLGLLESQLRKLGKLASALEAGHSPAKALSKAGYNPRNPQTGKYLQLARRLAPQTIRQHYHALLDADMELKSSALDGPAVVAGLLVKLTQSVRTPKSALK